MQVEYSFITDYAKSDRSRCKFCVLNISKDSLRLATIYQSTKFDGKITNWFHFECFFEKNKVKTIEDIQNIELLRWDDREKIKSKTGLIEKVETILKYDIDYAKSKATKCKKCEDYIGKGSVRMFGDEIGPKNKKVKGSSTQSYHIDCFVSSEEIPELEISLLDGFKKLKEKDVEEVSKQFLKLKGKKRIFKDGNENIEVSNKRIKEDLPWGTECKSQNDILWSVRDDLERELSIKELGILLQYNNQTIPVGKSNTLDAVSDAMVFGCLNSCPECKGCLRYGSNKYHCVSNVNEWTKCLYSTIDVQRCEFKIPPEYINIEVMNNYRYIARDRILLKECNTPLSGTPLKGFLLSVCGVNWKDGYTKTKVEQKIKDLGGTVIKDVEEDTVVLIYGNGNGKKKLTRCDIQNLSLSEAYGVDVVDTDIFQDIDNGEDFVKSIKKRNLMKWGRSEEAIRSLKQIRMESYIKGSASSTVEEGSFVDPDSGLQYKSHIYRDNENQELYNVVLNMVDLFRGTNSYYKLQLLESKSAKKWWVFRSWGRIGTTIGNHKKESFHELCDALYNFTEIYLDKTGNSWKDRHQFKKQLNKFYPMDIDYGEKVTEKAFSEPSKTLAKPVEELLRFISDIDVMKKAMKEFKIDLKKMPLGKLSNKQIELAYTILSELQDLLTRSDPPTTTQLLEASTKFYTYMPHDFGMRTPPLIDSLDVIKNKSDMIESLKEIDIAYKLMNVENKENTVDRYYNNLCNKINVLEKGSDMYKIIETYLNNSHGESHDFNLEIINIFDLCRKDEDKRFQKFQSLPNHMMLWHGSKRINWAGILSQGLRIAPSEAPVTGYMFGKGIYFADMVSKSANYCGAKKGSPEGLLLLCEVALGNMTERLKDDTCIKLNAGENSCKGVGATAPNPSENFIDADGVVYPLGSAETLPGLRSKLLYNEYIVYNVAQVRQKYLLKVRFNYK